jgi:GNAT superfamily N-acetyltransferase
VGERSSRVVYVYDFGSAPVGTPDSLVQFNELTADEIRDRASTLVMGGESTLVPNAGNAGCVVGTLSGRTVYHVWYVRGDGARLQDVSTGWRPRGRVLFLHGGYTEPEFRARGIHSAALRWLLAREGACETAHAIGVVNADNVPAQRAVESVGFRAVGRVT